MVTNERAGAPAGVDQRRSGAAAARPGGAGAAHQPLRREHRRRQRLHALQRHPRSVLRRDAGAWTVRRCPVRVHRGDQLGDRDSPGAEGQGDARPARAPGRAKGEGRARRRADRAARRGGGPRRFDPGRARRPARRRRRGRLLAWPDPGRVDPHRRVRGGQQARWRSVALGLLLPCGLGLLRGGRRSRATATRSRWRAKPGRSAIRPRHFRSRSTAC